MPKRIVVALLALAVALGATYRVRNPEHRDMDATARQGVAGRFVTLRDGVTHYDLSGPDTGQRVLLVHGFSTPYYIWDSTAAALAASGFRVARYDLIGRGYSDRPDVEYSPDLFDRQALDLLDSLGWRDPVDIVGLSMGGMVVGVFAGRHPERVRSMTMVDPAAAPREELPRKYTLPVVGPLLWQALEMPHMAEDQVTDFVDPTRWPDWPARYHVQMQYRGFGRALRSTSINEPDLEPIYAKVGALGTRSLLIWGKEDHSVPFEYSAMVRRTIPQIEFHPIDHAAHLPHMEQAAVVNPILIQFLRAKPTPPAK